MRTRSKGTKPDANEVARRERVRAQLEEQAAIQRLRPLPSASFVADSPHLGEEMRQKRDREDQRLADERAGRPTKPFSEMDGFEIVFAMASYSGRAEYPPDLELELQAYAEQPSARLSKTALDSLAEINSLRQQLLGDEAETWMLDRAFAIMKASRSTAVVTEAARLILEVCRPPEDLQPTVDPPTPTKRGPAS